MRPRRRRIGPGRLETLSQFAPELHDFLRHLVRERHLVRVPARHGRGGVIRARDECLHHADAFEAHGAAGEEEDVARGDLTDE
jgi:hypothetical protein